MTQPLDRIGYHYYPDDRHYSQTELRAWLPRLHSLHAHWLVLHAGPERAVPESFLRGLIDAGIQPIVHLRAPLAAAPAAALAPLLSAYGHWGLRYVVVFDRPNLRANWPPHDWARPELIERFVDVLLPVLAAQRASGLAPILPPLEPGGDFWDTAFLGALLEALARRGQGSLLDELVLAAYAWTYDRPPDWGAGGPARWPEARPYHTPPGCQDQRGMRACDWYAAAAAQAGLPSLPILVVGGGALRTQPPPAVGPDPHVEQNLAAARAVLSGDLPASVLNFAFYPLAAEPDQPDHLSAWFASPDQPRPIVQAMRQLLDSIARSADHARPKPIAHYLLLPSSVGASWLHEWTHLAEFASAHRPSIGFSLDEARLAQHVTIAGGEDVFSRQVEQDLRAAGCRVERILGNPAPRASSTGDPHG